MARDLWLGACDMNSKLGLHSNQLSFPGDYNDLAVPAAIFKYTTFCHPPAILHINREARKEGLKRYTLAFGSVFEHDVMELKTKSQIYVNFEVDRIYVGDMRLGLVEGNNSPWAQLVDNPIQRLALPWNLDAKWIFDAVCDNDAKFWKNVKEITLFAPRFEERRALQGPELKGISFSHWMLAGLILADWAGAVADPVRVGPYEVWKILKGALSEKPADFHTQAQEIRVPKVKIIQGREGSARDDVEFLSPIRDAYRHCGTLDDRYFTSEFYEELRKNGTN